MQHAAVFQQGKVDFKTEKSRNNSLLFWGLFGFVLGILCVLAVRFPSAILTFAIGCSSILIGLQGLFSLVWMLSAWEHPEPARRRRRALAPPQYSFTAIIPARHEEAVIGDTIKAVANIAYPKALKEVLIVCRSDDAGTIAEVNKRIRAFPKMRIRLVLFNDSPINKPHALNIGLREARGEVIAIFDAEDEPHARVYRIANDAMIRWRTDVVQLGVQLMNYRSRWFSALNVLEYFFWFKSGLPFFTRVFGITPLGGNSVFFKRSWLEYVGGWDEQCLTEDADIGFRLAQARARVHVTYEETSVTREETPATTRAFIRQRTRWIQGFFQTFQKGDWRSLPTVIQRLSAQYVLLSPLVPVAFLLGASVTVAITLARDVPLPLALLSFVPLYLLALQMLISIMGLYAFTRVYQLPFPVWMPLKVALTFLPYYGLHSYAAFRAILRVLAKKNDWEKTAHSNAHRTFSPS